MKIFFFSRDPGGTNALIPLIHRLRQKKHDVIVFGKDSACTRYAGQNIHYQTIGKTLTSAVKFDAVVSLLDSLRPDCIMTGTSEDDMTEKYLWKAAAMLKIPAIAILDYWTNYTLRFSHNVDGLSRLKKRMLEYLPDRICVMDRIAYNDMQAEGFASKKMVITGNPYLEAITRTSRLTPAKMKRLKGQLNIQGDSRVITFVSEPLYTLYGKKAIRELGYDEASIFKQVCSALVASISQISQKNILLVIRPHPKDMKDLWRKRLARMALLKCAIADPNSISSRDLIQLSDLVIGMSSIFLLEAALMNKPVISVQIGLKQNNLCILPRLGGNPSILSLSDLVSKLKSYLAGEKDLKLAYVPIKNATGRILKVVDNLMKGTICRT